MYANQFTYTPLFLICIMKNYNSLFFLCILCLLVFGGCHENQNKEIIYYQKENAENFNDRIKLEVSGELALALDEESGFSYSSIDIKEVDSINYLSYLNYNNNNVYVYNIDSPKTIAFKTPLDKGGANGVGTLSFSDAHLFINPDSIYIYNYKDGILYLVNQMGHVVDKQIIKPENENSNRSIYPYPSTKNPIVRIGNHLFLTGHLANVEDSYNHHKAVIRYNIKSKEVDNLFNFPERYQDKIWGLNWKYIATILHNPNTNKLILNFPTDPFIYEANIDGDILSEYFVGASKFKKIPHMGHSAKEWSKIRYEDIAEFSMTTSDYNRVLYDPYRGYFYRIAYVRPDLEMYEKGLEVPNLLVMIITEQFEKVGELELSSDKYDVEMIFVSKMGISFARRDLYNQNSDRLTFDVFTPINKY